MDFFLWTRTNGTPIAVNPQAIRFVEPSGDKEHTHVWLFSTNESISIKEKFIHVCHQIREKKAA